MLLEFIQKLFFQRFTTFLFWAFIIATLVTSSPIFFIVALAFYIVEDIKNYIDENNGE